MNKLQIGIGVIITVAILVISLSLTQQEIETEELLDNQEVYEEEVLPEIQEKLDEIKQNRLENKYLPKEREWISSGPFQIDRSEYVLGEKIFVKFQALQSNEKGQIVFLRPLNDTHYSVYITIPFDGMKKSGFNYYLQPSLSESKGICTVNDILGEWKVVFRGTQYSNLNFNIIDQILPGDEDDFEKSVC